MTERRQNEQVKRRMLAAIRQNLKASAPFDAARHESHARGEVVTRAARAPVPAAEPAPSLVQRFRQALEAVGGRCTVVRGEEEAARALRQIIDEREARSVAVSDSPLVRRVIERVESNAVLLENPAAPALFDCDIGVTGAQWGIAETGTLVLESDPERHRLVSLVPPVHVALLEAARIRDTLGEVLESIGERGAEGLSRAVTLITGPSRTSDIELTLAIGVHGPGRLYVVILDDVTGP